MVITIDVWTREDDEAVRALAADPAITPQFWKIQGPGRLEYWLADPLCDPGSRFVARSDGELAGFAYALLLHTASAPWAMLRVAVAPKFRRQGIAARLIGAQIARIAEAMPDCRELSTSAYEPCPDAAGLAARLGFQPVRTFWLMERPTHDLPAPAWPAGIEVCAFDGSERALEDWNDTYNASFARHFHFVPSTLEECRALARIPGFDPTTLLLAYDGERCVGFCRNEVHADSGEVGGLGVIPEWQGRGLGRALLRWGAQWLLEHHALPITLLVDGENEGALGLYRSEDYAITKTRRVWSRMIAPGELESLI